MSKPFDESVNVLPHATYAAEQEAFGDLPPPEPDIAVTDLAPEPGQCARLHDDGMPCCEPATGRCDVSGIETCDVHHVAEPSAAVPEEPEAVNVAPVPAAAHHETLESQPTPLKLPAAPQGIDWYHGDGPVDFVELRKGGKSFAIRKATQGLDLHDAGFAADWKAMCAAGLVRGATHFWRPSMDAVAQADFFLNTVAAACAAIGEDIGDAAPLLCLDVEAQPKTRPALDGKTPEECAEWCRAFVSHIAERTGVFCVVYSSQNFFADYMHGVELGVANLGGPFRGSPLWAVKHRRAEAGPEVPNEWQPNGWLISQYAFDNRETHGATQCDLDLWHTVSKGSTGRLVAAWQAQFGLEATGTFDDAFDAAVRHFQNTNGLTVDGRIGPVTGSRALWW